MRSQNWAAFCQHTTAEHSHCFEGRLKTAPPVPRLTRQVVVVLRNCLYCFNNCSQSEHRNILRTNLPQEKPSHYHLGGYWSGDGIQHLLLFSCGLPMFTSGILLDAISWCCREMCQSKGHHRLNLCALSYIRMGRLDIGHSSNLPRLGPGDESSD
jgi:hypothetical protein